MGVFNSQSIDHNIKRRVLIILYDIITSDSISSIFVTYGDNYYIIQYPSFIYVNKHKILITKNVYEKYIN